MNWLKKLFSGGTTGSTGPDSRAPEPQQPIAPRVQPDDGILAHADRMEAEGRRTGDGDLILRAARIRKHFPR